MRQIVLNLRTFGVDAESRGSLFTDEIIELYAMKKKSGIIF